MDHAFLNDYIASAIEQARQADGGGATLTVRETRMRLDGAVRFLVGRLPSPDHLRAFGEEMCEAVPLQDLSKAAAAVTAALSGMDASYVSLAVPAIIRDTPHDFSRLSRTHAILTVDGDVWRVQRGKPSAVLNVRRGEETIPVGSERIPLQSGDVLLFGGTAEQGIVEARFEA